MVGLIGVHIMKVIEASSLHKHLCIATPFSPWIKYQLQRYDHKPLATYTWKRAGRGAPCQEYLISEALYLSIVKDLGIEPTYTTEHYILRMNDAPLLHTSPLLSRYSVDAKQGRRNSPLMKALNSIKQQLIKDEQTRTAPKPYRYHDLIMRINNDPYIQQILDKWINDNISISDQEVRDQRGLDALITIDSIR